MISFEARQGRYAAFAPFFLAPVSIEALRSNENTLSATAIPGHWQVAVVTLTRIGPRHLFLPHLFAVSQHFTIGLKN